MARVTLWAVALAAMWIHALCPTGAYPWPLFPLRSLQMGLIESTTRRAVDLAPLLGLVAIIVEALRMRGRIGSWTKWLVCIAAAMAASQFLIVGVTLAVLAGDPAVPFYSAMFQLSWLHVHALAIGSPLVAGLGLSCAWWRRRREGNADTAWEGVRGATVLVAVATCAVALPWRNVDARDSAGKTSLLRAVDAGDGAMMRALVDVGSDVNAHDDSYWAPLTSACKRGDLEAARLLIGAGADVRLRAPSSELGFALALARSEPAAELIVGRPVRPPVPGEFERLLSTSGVTPAMFAVEVGSPELLQLLIGAGAEVDGISNRVSALCMATRAARLDLMRILIAAGADVDAQQGASYDRPLRQAVELDNSGPALLLLESGAKPAPEDFRVASGKGSEELIDAFLAAHVDVNCGALAQAARAGRLIVVERLLHAGAEPNTKLTGDDPALVAAVEGGDRDVVRVLLKAGAAPESEAASGQRPLMCAAARGDIEMVRMLLAAGANPEARARSGPGGALHYAIQAGALDVVRVLVESGADVNAEGEFRRTPFQQAEARGQAEMIELLRTLGAR